MNKANVLSIRPEFQRRVFFTLMQNSLVYKSSILTTLAEGIYGTIAS